MIPSHRSPLGQDLSRFAVHLDRGTWYDGHRLLLDRYRVTRQHAGAVFPCLILTGVLSGYAEQIAGDTGQTGCPPARRGGRRLCGRGTCRWPGIAPPGLLPRPTPWALSSAATAPAGAQPTGGGPSGRAGWMLLLTPARAYAGRCAKTVAEALERALDDGSAKGERRVF
jgi:hypothetical protein